MLALPLLVLAAASPTTPLTCESVTRRDYESLRALPKGAEEAMGQSMADKGQDFQATDVVTRPGLPRRRFVHAMQQKCRLTISYEQGGIAHRWLSLILIGDRSGWKAGL